MEAGGDYRLVGGHMVRLLLEVYPTPRAAKRSTTDADAALDDVEVITHVSQHLIGAEFEKRDATLFVKQVAEDQEVEVNLLMARSGPKPGLKPQYVPGLGQVDTLPELEFALLAPPLVIDVEAHLTDGSVLSYETRVPDLEVAVVLKAHSWTDRRSDKDLQDLFALLEIREAHPRVRWMLSSAPLKGRRLDCGRIMSALARELARDSGSGRALPNPDDRLRLAALIRKHVTVA